MSPDDAVMASDFRARQYASVAAPPNPSASSDNSLASHAGITVPVTDSERQVCPCCVAASSRA